MKLRYYLRGLGIGIVVTALVMGVIGKEGRPLTDAEIRAAARELGMVESDALKLTDIQPDMSPGDPGGTGMQGQDESSGGAESREENEASEGTEFRDDEEASGDSGSPDGSEGYGESGETRGTDDMTESSETASSAEPGSEPSDAEPAESSAPEETVTVTIMLGSGSGTVCRQLEEAGLIEDAREYDRYLINQGYSKRICAGTYEIPAGADWEKITKIITRTR